MHDYEYIQYLVEQRRRETNRRAKRRAAFRRAAKAVLWIVTGRFWPGRVPAPASPAGQQTPVTA